MRIKVPDSLQKEWLEKELEGCLDKRKVVNYFRDIYGSFEDLKSLGIINRWDIFDNPYAMRASYLKYLSDIQSLPKGIYDTLISFNLQRLNWKIAVPASFFLPTLNKLKVFRLKKFLFLLQLLGILQV